MLTGNFINTFFLLCYEMPLLRIINELISYPIIFILKKIVDLLLIVVNH